jgi:hypothetical protein
VLSGERVKERRPVGWRIVLDSLYEADLHAKEICPAALYSPSSVNEWPLLTAASWWSALDAASASGLEPFKKAPVLSINRPFMIGI